MKKKEILLLVLILLLTANLFAQKPSTEQLAVATETNALVKVKTAKMDGTPRFGEVIVFEDKESKARIQSTTDEGGNCRVTLEEGHSFSVYSLLLNDQQQISELDVPVHPGALTFTMTLQWDQSEREVRLDDIHFDTGKATLRSSSLPILEELYSLLQFRKNMVIEVQGHTDDVGSDESNQSLSEARAKAVREYLIKKGIDEKRLQSNGYGETKPIANNATKEGKQENRRTVVKILSE